MRPITHGWGGTRLYKIWHSMHRRCNLISVDRSIQDLVWHGLKVYEGWISFESFKKWALANGYEEHLSLDRIKNHLGYSPENCRWVTKSAQCYNRDTYGKSVFRGVAKSEGRWKAYKSKTPRHIGTFDTELEAALAYDAAVYKENQNAYLNFPEQYRNENLNANL